MPAEMDPQSSSYMFNAPVQSTATTPVIHSYQIKRLNDESYNHDPTWSYYPSVAPAVEYPQPPYEPAINAEIRNLDNVIFETTPSHQIASNPSGSTSNFSAVLYSSLSTLSNDNEHQSQIVSQVPSNSLMYNTSEAPEFSYMNNVLNGSLSNTSFYNGYLPEEEFPIHNVESGTAHYLHYQQQPQHNGNFIVTSPNSQTEGNQFTNATTTNEDCFDKNSDSAVSSMSSDRVHSFSDNDWPETSSESSSFAGSNLTDYHSTESKTSAQKKYRLFGKTKTTDNKTVATSSSGGEYYADYPHYVYPGVCPTNDGFGQVNYYALHHNHSYSQPAEIPVPNMLISQPNGEWTVNNENQPNTSNIKREDDSYQAVSTKSSKKQQSCDANNNKNRDPHLNRDEKRARALKIPITTQDIINLPIDEFNERLTKYELTEMQLSLIRDIRRRGKNKVAAQNCRKRKLDQIMGLQTEVDSMFSQKGSLEAEYNHLIMLREMARNKYTKLYHFVLESSSSRQQFFELTASPSGFPDKDNSQQVQLNENSSHYMLSSNITSPGQVSQFGGVPTDFKQE